MGIVNTKNKKISLVPSPAELRTMVNVDDCFGFTDKDLLILYNAFDKIDIDANNFVTHQQLMKHFKLVETPFVRRVLNIFDHDGDQHIEFREFAVTLWTYCSLSGADIHVFAFDLYDVDGSGFIEKEEVHLMLGDMYGEDFTRKVKALKIMEQLTAMESDRHKSPKITIDAWKEFLHRHNTMLFPAFLFQRKLREGVNGRAYWDKVAQQRSKRSDTEKQFPRLHVARQKASAAAGKELLPISTPSRRQRTKSDTHNEKVESKPPSPSPASYQKSYVKKKDKQRQGMQRLSLTSNSSNNSRCTSPLNSELDEDADDIPSKFVFKTNYNVAVKDEFNAQSYKKDFKASNKIASVDFDQYRKTSCHSVH